MIYAFKGRGNAAYNQNEATFQNSNDTYKLSISVQEEEMHDNKKGKGGKYFNDKLVILCWNFYNYLTTLKRNAEISKDAASLKQTTEGIDITGQWD